MKKSIKKRDVHGILNFIVLVIFTTFAILSLFHIGGRTNSIISALCILASVPLALIQAHYRKKDRKFRDKIHLIEFQNIFRGEILDEMFGNHIRRECDQNDWDYVKKIFAIIYDVNPKGALSILFGKPVGELDEVSEKLARNFLASRQTRKDVKTLLGSVGENDPGFKVFTREQSADAGEYVCSIPVTLADL